MHPSIAKEQEQVRLALQKLDIPPAFKIDIKLIVDVSGSFRDAFTVPLPQDGYAVDPLFTAALAIACELDPSRSLRIIGFSDQALDTGNHPPERANEIRGDFLHRARPILWGGTDYSRALEILLHGEAMGRQPIGALRGLFGFGNKLARRKEAFLLLFVSDGEDMGSGQHFLSQLKQLAAIGAYVALIGANADPSVPFERMQQAAADVDGCAFHRLTDLAGLDTRQLCEILFDPAFTSWRRSLPDAYKS